MRKKEQTTSCSRIVAAIVKKTLSMETIYSRTCCSAYFHHRCIKSCDFSRCPCCGVESRWNNTQTLLWAPAESLLENEPCPAKRRKVEGGEGETCVICLDDCSEMAKVVTTNSCCKQTAHVACLQRYYDLPATCLNPRELQKIRVQLGLPNCFICHGT